MVIAVVALATSDSQACPRRPLPAHSPHSGGWAPLVPPVLQGWDKTYCLQFVKADFDEIHFFGDKTFKVGGSM
jgi:hypothetical protein